MSDIYDPIEQVTAYLENHFSGEILDIGPGPKLFPTATCSADWNVWKDSKVADNHVVDINFNIDQLPFKDIDYVYCRHVVEDLRNPYNLFEEIKKVATKGYIETPSPYHELLAKVDKGNPWKGHYHHMWFVWTEDNVLNLMPKISAIEFVKTQTLFSTDVFDYNNYYLFEDGLKYKIWELGRDLEIKDYFKLLQRALHKSAEHKQEFKKLVLND